MCLCVCVGGGGGVACRKRRSGDKLPRENVRKPGLPWTAFRAILRRSRECRVVKRRRRSPSLGFL